MFLGVEDGSHIGAKGLELLKVKAFRLEPMERSSTQPGILDVDGEVVPFGAIEAKPHAGALRVLSLGPTDPRLDPVPHYHHYGKQGHDSPDMI